MPIAGSDDERQTVDVVALSKNRLLHSGRHLVHSNVSLAFHNTESPRIMTAIEPGITVKSHGGH